MYRDLLFRGPRPAAWLLIASLALEACSVADASTYVGNPTNLTLGPISEVFVTGLVLPLHRVESRPCGGSYGVGVSPVLIGGRPEFYLAPGTCEVRLTLNADVHVAGTALDGADVSLTLETPPTLVLVFAEPFAPADDNDRYLVEVGTAGWTSRAELLPNGGSSVTITPSSAPHDDLVDALVAGTAVFANPNGDGAVQPSERAAGPLAVTP